MSSWMHYNIFRCQLCLMTTFITDNNLPNVFIAGNYFTSHFFMGGEKFDTPHPEGYLFGENMDLNFLGNRPVQVTKWNNLKTLTQSTSHLHIYLVSHSFPMWPQLRMSLWRRWGVWWTSGRILYDLSGIFWI